MQRGRVWTAWQQAPVAVRSALTAVLGAVAVAGAISPWLLLAQAWMLSGDEASGMAVPRLITMRENLLFAFFTADSSVMPVAVGAAFTLVLISIACRSEHRGVGVDGAPQQAEGDPPRFRGIEPVTAAALLAAVVAMAAALIRVGLELYVMVSPPALYREQFYAASQAVQAAQRLSSPVVEGLAWAAVLLLGVLRWQQRPELDQDGAEHDEHQYEPDGADRSRHTEPRQEPRPTLSAAETGPAPPDIPPRLRPDGSSDSGFDEFRFRR